MTSFLLAVVVGMAAQPSQTVVIVANHADARVVPLLRSELEGLGLTVHIVDRGPNEIVPDDLRQAARAHQAAAAFRVLSRQSSVEVWLADRVTGKIVLREVLLSEAGARVKDADVALRAVELLRASLLELDSRHPSRGEVPATDVIRLAAVDPEREARFGFRLTGQVLVLQGGLPAGAGFLAGADFGLTPRMRVGAWLAISMTPATVSGPEGRVVVTPALMGVGASWVPAPPRARWVPSLSVGLAGLWLHGEGTAVSPLVAQPSSVLLPAAWVEARVALALSRHIRVVASAMTMATFGVVSVSFAGREAARVGPAVLLGAAGLELVLP